MMQMSVNPTESPRAVQGTNDSSIVSKLSMSDAGYFTDPYLKYFVAKQARRAPLINRGYYIRAKAVDHVLTEFLSHFSSQPDSIQIISLGAGFDSSYFRLISCGKLRKHCRFIEIDFPSTVSRKVSLINSNALLLDKLTNPTQKTPCVFESFSYVLIGCDLRRLSELTKLLELCHVDYHVPTLLLSECVLTYMEPRRVNDLLHWSAKTFPNALFCTYEQIHPNDAFGLVMQEHFLSLHSPLRNVNEYPTRERQEQRYKEAGWKNCTSCNMNTFFCAIPMEEQQRVNSLELFDEFEGWHLKCAHYSMLCAYQGCCSSVGERLLPRDLKVGGASQKNLDLVSTAAPWKKAKLLSRFAHCSVELVRGEAVVVAGGFGCPTGVGPHTRLDDIVLLKSTATQGEEKLWQCVALETRGKGPGRLMYQTATLIPSLNTVLFYGGRASPAKPCGSCHSLRVSDSQAFWEEVELDRASQVPEPRWRHTATLVVYKGIEAVVVIGGRSEGVKALDDCYILDTSTWTFEKLDVALPEGRHTHCAEAYSNTVVIAGGLDASMQPLSSCLQLQFGEGGKWGIRTLKFDLPLPARYGMASSLYGDILWLLGGVQLSPSAGLLRVDLRNRKWVEFGVQSTVNSRPVLLNGHTCWMADGDMFVLGGGGNCFSFGTHINDSIRIDLGPTIS